VESGYGQVTPALAVSNGSASTLSPGALIDYRLRQHDLTEASDPTLAVVLDHWRDLDLATILGRMADQWEP